MTRGRRQGEVDEGGGKEKGKGKPCSRYLQRRLPPPPQANQSEAAGSTDTITPIATTSDISVTLSDRWLLLVSGTAACHVTRASPAAAAERAMPIPYAHCSHRKYLDN